MGYEMIIDTIKRHAIFRMAARVSEPATVRVVVAHLRSRHPWPAIQNRQ